jgi:hypothetical protein
MKTTMTQFAPLFRDEVSLRGLHAADLPEPDYRSVYALEFAEVLLFYMSFETLEIKGISRFKKNQSWESLRTPLCLAVVINFLTSQANQSSIFSEKNARYLRERFNSIFDDMGCLIALPTDNPIDMAATASRSIRVIDSVVEKCQLRYSSDNNPLGRMMYLSASIAGAFAGAKSLCNSSSISGDLLEPLRAIPDTKEFMEPNRHLPPPIEAPNVQTKSHPVEGLSNAGSAKPQYEKWVQYCKDAAKLQRLPERLIADLIPPIEIANHSLKNPIEWEDALEETFPGRRQWLLDEGVTRKDFDTFWGFPSWVQNFIEALMKRNQQMEFKSVVDLGKSEEQAAIHTAMFIPYFDVRPHDAGPETRPLPFELFERVRRYYASLDEEWQMEFVTNRCVTLNQYLRICIKEKRF